MIQYNDKNYRNIQEQVQKNMVDIQELNVRVHDLEEEIVIDTYSKTQIDAKDAAVLTEAKAYTYSQSEIDSKDETTLSTAKTYTDNMITAVENTHYSITQADYKFLAKANLTDNSILEAHIGNSAIDVDNVDLMAVTSQDVYGRVSVEPTSTIIKNSNGTDISQIGMSATEIDVTTGMFKYGTSEVATKADLPAAVSGTNDGTNWTTLTIGNDTYNIGGGGSGSSTMYNHVLEITKVSASSTNTDFKVNVQFNNFNNTQITSYNAFMTAFANHRIPEVLIGNGWGRTTTVTSLLIFNKVTIESENNRVEFRFTNPEQTWTPVVFYLQPDSTTYTITDTVTPITA